MLANCLLGSVKEPLRGGLGVEPESESQDMCAAAHLKSLLFSVRPWTEDLTGYTKHCRQRFVCPRGDKDISAPLLDVLDPSYRTIPGIRENEIVSS